MRGTRSEPLVHVLLLLRIWRCRRALLGGSSNDGALALQAHRNLAIAERMGKENE